MVEVGLSEMEAALAWGRRLRVAASPLVSVGERGLGWRLPGWERWLARGWGVRRCCRRVWRGSRRRGGAPRGGGGWRRRFVGIWGLVGWALLWVSWGGGITLTLILSLKGEERRWDLHQGRGLRWGLLQGEGGRWDRSFAGVGVVQRLRQGRRWIPAFAGMTKGVAGMTVIGGGFRVGTLGGVGWIQGGMAFPSYRDLAAWMASFCISMRVWMPLWARAMASAAMVGLNGSPSAEA